MLKSKLKGKLNASRDNSNRNTLSNSWNSRTRKNQNEEEYRRKKKNREKKKKKKLKNGNKNWLRIKPRKSKKTMSSGRICSRLSKPEQRRSLRRRSCKD